MGLRGASGVPASESAGPPANRSARRATAIFVALVASAAPVLLALGAPEVAEAVGNRPGAFASFVGLAVALQLFAGLHERGSLSVSGVGVLATGFALGVGPGVVAAIACAVAHAIRRRSPIHRAAFTAGTLALAASGGSALYGLASTDLPAVAVLVTALAAGVVYAAVNTSLLALVMSRFESRPPLAVWDERFRPVIAHYLAFGPLALAAVLAHETIGLIGLVAFAMPPALLTVSVRQCVVRMQARLEAVAPPPQHAERRA